MDEIAKKAGLGSGTLYRHFPHLGELLATVMSDVITAVVADLYEAAKIPEPDQALRAGMYALAGRIATNRAIRDVFLQHVQQHRIEITPELGAANAQTMELLDELARRAQQAGALRTDITAADLLPLLGTIGSIRVPNAPADLWERYLDLLLDGLAPEAATGLRHQPPPQLIYSATGPVQ
jgi:AcrR family transcriptional regulator